MDDSILFGIGDLARRTGLSVRTIRFYSDSGLVTPAVRSAAGYRLYDQESVLRLDIVRTLRQLGLDLSTIGRLLAREVTVSEVAAAQLAALDAQIRTLRLRQAVLRAAAGRAITLEEVELMHRLANLSNQERQRVVHDFVDEMFGDLDANPAMLELLRSAAPSLPDDPSAEQIQAWVELAELVQDEEFRASVRRMAEYQAEQRAGNGEAESELHGELLQMILREVDAARAAGVEPDSEQAELVVRDVIHAYAEAFRRPANAETGRWILHRLEVANDQRVERYWHLLATINGSPHPPTLAATFEWLTVALRQHRAPDPLGDD